VMGGNISGITTILVEPFHMENHFGFRFKRKIESAVFKRDYSKLERL
jgi:predicted HAD superfamily phosphohydrolase YqeG